MVRRLPVLKDCTIVDGGHGWKRNDVAGLPAKFLLRAVYWPHGTHVVDLFPSRSPCDLGGR